jgi:hypothetical protein
VAWAKANGILVSHTPEINGLRYHIVRYDRKQFQAASGQVDGDNAMDMDDDVEVVSKEMTDPIRLLRSVILCNGKIVSVSLPKCTSDYDPSTSTLISESVMEEGPMINAFYMPGDSRIVSADDTEQFGWQISTRSVFGAKNSFFENENGQRVTFREMFLEAMPATLFSSLNRNYCYSFVIRSPQNRDVYGVSSPRLMLAAVFQKIDDFCWQYVSPAATGLAMCSIPKRVSDVSGTDYMGTTTIFVKDGLLHRTKTILDEYKGLRELRGTQPKLLYHYLVLRKQRVTQGQTGQNTIADYLSHYPEHKTVFNQFRQRVHDYTIGLQKSYWECFVRHLQPLNSFDVKYRKHMKNLHTMFKDSKKPNTLRTVIDYVNGLDPAQLMYVLNWERHVRQNHEVTNEVASPTNMATDESPESDGGNNGEQ